MNSTGTQFSKLKEKFNEAIKSGDFSNALTIAESIVVDWPKDPCGWNGLAQVANATLPLSELIPHISELYADSPKSKGITNVYFSALIRQGDVRKAEEILKTFESLNTDELFTLRLRSQLETLKANFGEAESLNLKISEIIPNNPEPLFGVVNLRVAQNNIDGALGLLETLKNRGSALPVHLYWAEHLHEQRAGRWISLKRSAEFVREYPGDDAVAMRHSRNIQFLGRSVSQVKFLEEYIERYQPSKKPVWMAYAAALMTEKQYDAATDIFKSISKFGPHGHETLLGIARCHYNRQDFDKALEVLSEAEPAPSVGVHLLRAQIYLRYGEPTAVFNSSVAAFRLCPDPRTHAALARSLLNMGRYISARKVMSALERNFPDLVASWAQMADFEADFGSMDRAIFWYERLIAHPDSFSIGKYSDTLWQLGFGERAWHAALADTTRRFGLLSLDSSERKSTFVDLIDEISRCKKKRDSSVGRQRTVWATRLANIYVRPHTVKVFGSIDKKIIQRLRVFSDLERRGLAGDALTAIDKYLPKILESIAEETKYFNLVRRVAKVAEDCGATERAMLLYEQAARLSTSELFGHRLHQRAMQNSESHIRIEGAPRVAILIVTWKGNVAAAEEIARLVHDRTGRTIVALTADEKLTRVEIVKRTYGYDMTVPCSDGYEALPEKVTRALRHLFVCSNSEGVLKIDDDIVINNLEKFEAMIQTFQSEELNYVGSVRNHVNPLYHNARLGVRANTPKIASHRKCLFCDGGEGYYLSKKSLRQVYRSSLVELPPDVSGTIYEDIYLGELMNISKTIPKDMRLPEIGGFTINCYEPLALLNKSKESTTDVSLKQKTFKNNDKIAAQSVRAKLQRWLRTNWRK